MGRLFIFAMCLCVVTALVAILRIPEANFLRALVTNRTEATRSSSEDSENVSARASANASSSAAAGPFGDSSGALGVPSLETSSSPSRLDSPFMNVLTDSVPVYAINSPDGDVLRHLQEGDQVEAGVQVLGPEGWWIEVRLDPQTSGFMLSENLGRN